MDGQQVEKHFGMALGSVLLQSGAQENMSVAKAAWGGARLTHSHRRWERISRNTGCGWRPAGKGTCETVQPESGGDLRWEEEQRELTYRVRH